MEEYRIDMKLRNNLILTKIEEAGYTSVLAFCKATGVIYETLIAFVNMRRSIYNSQGKVRDSVIRICQQLKCMPEEIFSANQMEASLKTNKRTLKVNEAEAMFLLDQADSQKLLEDHYSDDQLCDSIDKALSTLTPRERRVIEMRMGMGEYESPYTLEQCGNVVGVTRERLRQIEAKALRKMRHPMRSGSLREFLSE